MSKSEGTVSFTLNRNDIWKYGTLTVSPFDWLEAGYFYYRPSDMIWGNKRGAYLDKGFNVKFIYNSKKTNIPNFAIGLDDFSGTGLFTKEYMVMSQNFKNSVISLGVGWGKLSGKNSFKNPLSFISDGLIERPIRSDNYNLGGSLAYDKWFRGNASVFGGVEYFLPHLNGIKLKLELDTMDYFDLSGNNREDLNYEIRNKDSDINFGISIPWNKYLNFDISFIKGNTLNLSFTYGITFNNQTSTKPKFKPDINTNKNTNGSKNIFYEDLLQNLNKNRLLLQTSNLSDKGNLDISISTSDYRNAIKSSSYAAYIAQKVAKENNIKLKTINISHVNAGIETNKISYFANHFENKNVPYEIIRRYTNLDSGTPSGYMKNEFQPNINFPVIFSSISPSVRSYIGDPGKFYFGGIDLNHNSEIQFSRNLILSSEFTYPIYNNFSDINYKPDSVMQHVRTDIVKYLKEDNIYINRMQLDYIWSPAKDIYSKITGGILESMFSGIGGEFLYKPFDKNYSIGYELFYVKQRSFNRRFGTQKYDTFTGHINFGYRFAKGIESNLSYGRYLAEDHGYTLDLSRTTKSGFKAGIYFTRTNVSAETFGEGSFDKGFYFQIPIDLILNQYSGEYSTFKISPLTRDGGAKLIHDKDLKGLIYNSTYYELSRQWDGFLNK